MTDEQNIVLDKLKSGYRERKVNFPALAFDKMIKDPLASIAYDHLTRKQEFEVIKAFGEWGLKDE